MACAREKWWYKSLCWNDLVSGVDTQGMSNDIKREYTTQTQWEMSGCMSDMGNFEIEREDYARNPAH